MGDFFDGLTAKDLLTAYNQRQVTKALGAQQSLMDARLTSTSNGVTRDGLALSIGGGNTYTWMVIGGFAVVGLLLYKAL